MDSARAGASSDETRYNNGSDLLNLKDSKASTAAHTCKNNTELYTPGSPAPPPYEPPFSDRAFDVSSYPLFITYPNNKPTASSSSTAISPLPIILCGILWFTISSLTLLLFRLMPLDPASPAAARWRPYWIVGMLLLEVLWFLALVLEVRWLQIRAERRRLRSGRTELLGLEDPEAVEAEFRRDTETPLLGGRGRHGF